MLHSQRVTCQQNTEKQVCSKLHLQAEQVYFSSICSFTFKIKQKDLIVQKNKKTKGAFVQFIAVSLLTSDPVDSYLEDTQISYQMFMILTRVLRLQILIFCIFKYVMYVLLCKQRQSNNCIYKTCRCLSILIGKNATANEFQQVSN